MNYCNKSLKTLCFILILSFVMISFSYALEYIVPKIPYGLTSADIDLDGDVDVIVGSRNSAPQAQDTISIFTNNGFGYFDITYLEREMAHYLKCRKINNDVLPDLVTKILEDYQIVYYANEGNGQFGNAIPIHSTLSDHREYIRISDMNNDDINDIVFYKRGSTDCYWGILENNGFGVFTENLYYTTDAVIGDIDVGLINADVLPDVVITTSHYGTIIFYNNLNGFTQEELYPNPYHSPYLFDMDNDGDNEIGIFEYHEFFSADCKLRVFYNNGNSTFTQPDTLHFASGSLLKDIADYNNDGYPDIAYYRYLYSPPYSIHVRLNNTDGTFADPIEYNIGHPTVLKIISADLDDNSFLDLIITGYVGDDNLYRVKMLFNDGTGNFLEEPQVGISNYELSITNYELRNYPNPFNPITTIYFEATSRSRAETTAGNLHENSRIEIFNIKGQRIKKLEISPESVWEKLGINEVVWNGRDENNKPVGSGIYFYKLEVNDKTEAVKKCLLLK